MNRRSFLRLALGSTAAPLLTPLAGCDPGESPWRDADVAEAAAFPDGVVAGGPTEDAITLLLRTADTAGLRRLGLDVSDDPSLENVVQSGIVDLSAADPQLPMQVRLSQLQPGATYYYRFSSRTGSSPVGRFRTLRRASDPAPARVAFFSCQVARGLEHQAVLINPGLRFIDVVSRGYSVLEARPDELLVTLRSPETTFEPSSPTRDLAVFRLRHGSLAVERVA